MDSEDVEYVGNLRRGDLTLGRRGEAFDRRISAESDIISLSVRCECGWFVIFKYLQGARQKNYDEKFIGGVNLEITLNYRPKMQS